MAAEGSTSGDLERAAVEGKKKIIDKILKDAEAEAKDIMIYAEKQVQEIISNAMTESGSIRGEMLKKGNQEALTEKSRILSQARLDSRRKILEAKERELSAILEETKSILRDADKIPDYEAVMKMITIEACTSIGGGNLSLRTNCKGKEALDPILSNIEEQVSEETGKTTKVELLDEGVSGVVVESESGVMVDNSFVTRLERRRREIRKELADILF